MPKFKSIPQREYDIMNKKAIRNWALGRISAQELEQQIFTSIMFPSLYKKEEEQK